MRDLILRGVLRPPKLLPRFLDDEAGLAANRVVFGLLGQAPITLKDVLSGGTGGNGGT